MNRHDTIAIPSPVSRRGGEGLSVNRATVVYRNGHNALRDASFSIPTGTITALVGVNGSGKSTKPAQQVARETNARYGGVLYVDSLSGPNGPTPTYIDLLSVTAGRVAKGLTPIE